MPHPVRCELVVRQVNLTIRLHAKAGRKGVPWPLTPPSVFMTTRTAHRQVGLGPSHKSLSNLRSKFVSSDPANVLHYLRGTYQNLSEISFAHCNTLGSPVRLRIPAPTSLCAPSMMRVTSPAVPYEPLPMIRRFTRTITLLKLCRCLLKKRTPEQVSNGGYVPVQVQRIVEWQVDHVHDHLQSVASGV